MYIRRSDETEAAYLLGRLRSGMRILDISCGLGSISVCLAAAVALGEFQGIDMEQSQIDVATSVAQEAGLSSALFQVANALDLRFPDDYFDAVHCNAIIVHIPDTSAVLAVIVSNGGHSKIGKELKSKLVGSGLADAEPTGTVELFSPPSDLGASIGFETFQVGILGTINSELGIERGLATTEEFGRWNKAFLTWQDDSGAL